VLKEVHYIESRHYENVPAEATQLYSRRDELRKYVINLELLIYFYNKIRQTVLEVEYPLIEGRLSDIDEKLLQAENSLTWNSPGMLLSGNLCNYASLLTLADQRNDLTIPFPKIILKNCSWPKSADCLKPNSVKNKC